LGEGEVRHDGKLAYIRITEMIHSLACNGRFLMRLRVVSHSRIEKIVFCFLDNLLLIEYVVVAFTDYCQSNDSLYELGVADKSPFIAKLSNVDV
jgi:hypothetical protein